MSKELFFIGPEVEHTPAFSKKTLFVVGKANIDTIEELAKLHKVQHVFLGAHLSFKVDPTDTTTYWNDTILSLLGKGYWVTLSYRAYEHELVLRMLSSTIWQSRNFVPLLGVGIPYLQTSNGNLTVRFDSNGQRATNPGVWCLHHHEITDSNRFTDWMDYDTDVGIALEVDKVPESPMVASISNVTINKDDLETPTTDFKFQESTVKNDVAAGLDMAPTTALKPDTDSKETITKLDIIDAETAADAYTEGTTTDPLAEEASKKSKTKKNKEHNE